MPNSFRLVAPALRIVNANSTDTPAKGTQYSIQVNPKQKIIHCALCNQNHAVPYCTRRKAMKLSSTEYVLTKEEINTELQLKNRLRVMPLADITTAKSVINNLPQECIRAPCIIHSCAETHIGRNYEVSFLLKDADLTPMTMYNRIWISENEMFKYASHSMKAKKFVFDETIMSNNRTPRTLVPPNVKQGDFGLPGFGQSL